MVGNTDGVLHCMLHEFVGCVGRGTVRDRLDRAHDTVSDMVRDNVRGTVCEEVCEMDCG